MPTFPMSCSRQRSFRSAICASLKPILPASVSPIFWVRWTCASVSESDSCRARIREVSVWEWWDLALMSFFTASAWDATSMVWRISSVSSSYEVSAIRAAEVDWLSFSGSGSVPRGMVALRPKIRELPQISRTLST